MKKIKFYSKFPELDIPVPVPAYKAIPKWFRKLPGVVDGIESIKKCMPFLDTMTSGYMVVLAADVKFDGENFEQISKIEMVTTHYRSQLGELEIPSEYSQQPFKWTNPFIVKTPKGYSTLFTHPLNRIDLPFHSLSGIVDTDMHPVPVNFPFLVKKDFIGIIPAGTPIAQAIPFKREKWKSKVEDRKVFGIPVSWYSFGNPPFNFYKRNFWKKKDYK